MLLVGAWILFKFVLGFLTAVAWIALVIGAVHRGHLGAQQLVTNNLAMYGGAYVAIMIFFGLSAGVIGKIKGSSFFLWFLIGFCLPVIGTIAALLCRWDRYEPRRRCEECGAVVHVHDQVCKRCGATSSGRRRSSCRARASRLADGVSLTFQVICAVVSAVPGPLAN